MEYVCITKKDLEQSKKRGREAREDKMGFVQTKTKQVHDYFDSRLGQIFQFVSMNRLFNRIADQLKQDCQANASVRGKWTFGVFVHLATQSTASHFYACYKSMNYDPFCLLQDLLWKKQQVVQDILDGNDAYSDVLRKVCYSKEFEMIYIEKTIGFVCAKWNKMHEDFHAQMVKIMSEDEAYVKEFGLEISQK